jgi:hypothetical protein
MCACNKYGSMQSSFILMSTSEYQFQITSTCAFTHKHCTILQPYHEMKFVLRKATCAIRFDDCIKLNLMIFLDVMSILFHSLFSYTLLSVVGTFNKVDNCASSQIIMGFNYIIT